MAQDTSDQFSQLWQRHLTVLRDDFSATSIQALPSLPSCDRSFGGEDGQHRAPDKYPSHVWDEKVISVHVVDALEELAPQSPITTDTRSPGTPWFPDRDRYTETTLSSPENSSWPKTVRTTRNPGLPYLILGDHPGTAFPELKEKGLDVSHDGIIGWRNHTHYPDPFTTTAATAKTALQTPTVTTPQKGPPSQVHVLMLSWAKHDQRSEDGRLLTPSGGFDTNSETETLRACLKQRGYRVQCRLIPVDYPTAAVETLLDKFLEKSTADSLLVIYYHGYGNLDGEGRMVFSSPGRNASSFFWDDVRDPVMQSTGDVLLVFDCIALPNVGEEQREMRIQAGLVSSPSTKQLLGVCVPSTAWGEPGGVMTRSLCRTLDGMGDVVALSVQRLCSLMREDLRGTELASRVFVSQLGGGQLLDIYLPTGATPLGAMRQSGR